MTLTGMHHITAISGDIQRNLDFYVGTLGLRLVKRTVIQEEPTTYHLFYGDRVGTIGTELSFFDWPHLGHDRPGPRNVVRTLLTVPDDEAIDWWARRLAQLGTPATRQQDFAGRASLHFNDPEGQRLALVADGANDAYDHWAANPVPQAYAIQGLHSAVLGVSEVEPTVAFLTEIFGYRQQRAFRSDAANEGQAVVLTLGDGGPGKEMVVVERTDARTGFRAIGSIHHIAIAIAAGDSIEAWRDRIAATGLQVTDVIRRYYFDSIYVRVPGGILFELATVGRGLAVDEDVETLGARLTLPPFLEDQRTAIEAQLKPIRIPEIELS
ncbi:MAG: VOC family protein [Anaerolineae bacterium]|nr:VOC family protein [Anaerolineae bacterium]